ncbi:DUF397 domain-containing protein [Streptomyces sp. NBC_00210]|uniref:DUF397 domain-containing protein n=1 Tax=Streptomyces sp. NBC_00210 TaxID=2903636 RepID=UPI00386F8A31
MLNEAAWRSGSVSGQTCLEARCRAEQIFVRDSKCPSRPHLCFGLGAWNAFLVGVRFGVL